LKNNKSPLFDHISNVFKNSGIKIDQESIPMIKLISEMVHPYPDH